MKSIQSVSLILLTGIIVWFGIIPALTRIDTDFPNYYTAARLVIERKDISRIYDDDWFQDQIHQYGIEGLGKFSPFPPITALIMIPLAALSPLNALRVWTIFNLCLVFLTIFLLTKILKKDWRWCTLLTLLTGIGLINNFRFGQFYLVMSFLIILGYYLYQQRFFGFASVAFGIGAAVKYFPLIFLPFFILEKNWKAAIITLLTVIVLYLITGSILGFDIYRIFLSGVFQEHIAGNLQHGYSAAFQSWDSLLRRLFIFDSEFNPQPFIQSSIAFVTLKTIIIFIIFMVTMLTYFKAKSNFGNEAAPIRFALLGIAGILLLPVSATYHFLMLILPAALILSDNVWNIWQKIIGAAYGLIGFIPYSMFRRFEGNGIMNIIAYPRLWLMTILFLSTVIYIYKHQKPIRINIG